jgi:nitrile hydratase
MNGIHDMGGMDGFGPVEAEENEPVFHERWEGRVYALFFHGLFPWYRGRNLPHLRFALESIRPDEYLRMFYYERWYEVIRNNLLRADLVTTRELEMGHRDPARPLPTQYPGSTEGRSAPPAPAPGFSIDDEVRVRNLHPRGHTRVPRYARGKQGIVVTDNGVWSLPDTDENGQGLGNFPQHVYTVRFESRELWGERASPRDVVYMDLWEEYIELA